MTAEGRNKLLINQKPNPNTKSQKWRKSNLGRIFWQISVIFLQVQRSSRNFRRDDWRGGGKEKYLAWHYSSAKRILICGPVCVVVAHTYMQRMTPATGEEQRRGDERSRGEETTDVWAGYYVLTAVVPTTNKIYIEIRTVYGYCI